MGVCEGGQKRPDRHVSTRQFFQLVGHVALRGGVSQNAPTCCTERTSAKDLRPTRTRGKDDGGRVLPGAAMAGRPLPCCAGASWGPRGAGGLRAWAVPMVPEGVRNHVLEAAMMSQKQGGWRRTGACGDGGRAG